MPWSSYRRSGVCTRPVFASLLFILALPSIAVAGQVTAAGIIGQVRDESGAVLPGVSVTVKSPALQVAEMLAVTDA